MYMWIIHRILIVIVRVPSGVSTQKLILTVTPIPANFKFANANILTAI